MVGAKCTLLARMDAYGQDPSGQAGEAMKVSAVCLHLGFCIPASSDCLCAALVLTPADIASVLFRLLCMLSLTNPDLARPQC